MENTTSVSDQDIAVAAELRTVIHRLVKLLRRETHGEGALSMTERSVMGSLYREELPPSTLAQLEKVTTQSMSQIINHLYELELIHKTPSAEDKRKVMLSLTAKGRRTLEALHGFGRQQVSGALEALTEAEQRMVREGMMLYARALRESRVEDETEAA